VSSTSHLRAAYEYTPDEWKRLKRASHTVMMPELFDDLLAATLPVDAMRILRYFWFRTWGRVRPNPWMSPQQVAERLPQWASEEAAFGHAYAVYSDLRNRLYDSYAANTRSPLPLDEWEPPYRRKRRLWADSWNLVEARVEDGKLEKLVEHYRAELGREQFYSDLMNVAVTKQELADAFGPRAVHRLGKRGRTRGSIFSTLRWMEAVGLIVERRGDRWTASTYEYGPEMWHVLTTGDFSPTFRARLEVKSPASQPFFRHRGRGFTPRAEGFYGVQLSLGPCYRAPYAMEALLEHYLPQPVMPVIWFVVRNTLGRDPETHSSLGYVAVGNKELARSYGPANVSNASIRGRRVSTVREAIDWCVENGILDRKRRGDWTQLSIGPELWNVFRNGRFSPRLSLLLSAGAARVTPSLADDDEDDLDRIQRLLSEDALSLGEMVRILGHLPLHREAS
jgi:hypothetical protein